ncbi:hypothetical protein ACLB2K_020642 [Fragaria x ananassa]
MEDDGSVVPRQSCLKLEPKESQPIFVKGTWFHSRFDLSIIDDLNAWVCHSSEDAQWRPSRPSNSVIVCSPPTNSASPGVSATICSTRGELCVFGSSDCTTRGPESSSVVETPGTAPVADAPGPVPVSVADAPGPTSGPTSDKHGGPTSDKHGDTSGFLLFSGSIMPGLLGNSVIVCSPPTNSASPGVSATICSTRGELCVFGSSDCTTRGPESSSVVETPGTAPVADAPGPVPVSVADAPGPTSGPTSDKHGGPTSDKHGDTSGFLLFSGSIMPWDQPVPDYVSLAERYLGFQHSDSVYKFTDAGNGHKRLSWTFDKEGTKLEWRWKCEPSPNSKETTAAVLDFLMDANVGLSEEVVRKTQSFERLKVEAEMCLIQSERIANEKIEFESAVYAKV